MHLFLQFNGRFAKKADRIARIFAERHGFDRFSGISTAEGHARWLQKPSHTPVSYHHVQALPELWRRALAHPSPNPARIRELESRYGNLWRFILADRNLGHTFLTGTVLPDTAMRRAANNLDTVLACIQVLFDYFEDRFTNDRPDLVFFQVVASSPALVAAAVAGRLEIPFLTLGKTKLDDRHHVAANALMQPDAAIERYASPDLTIAGPTLERVRASAAAEPPATDHFIADRRNFKERHGGSLLELVSHRLKALPEALRPWDKPYLPDPRNPTALESWQWETRVRWNYRQLVRAGFFDTQSVSGDYLFLALSVTPEASTCVVAPSYADQLIVISALARSLPAGWRLVVKDHLPMCGRRTRAFYEQATQYQNVVMVDPTLRSTELIRGARVTAVIAGTSGWEAMIMGRPVLTLGPVWYLATGLGVYCRNLDDLHEDILHAVELSGSFTFEERERRCARLMQALFDSSFPFSYDMMWKSFSDRDLDRDPTPWDRLAEAIHRRFESIRNAPPNPFDTGAWTRDRTPLEVSAPSAPTV